jgi:hypothetical protein
VIHGKRIVRMTCQDLLKILNRCVIIEVVVVIESRLVQCIGGTERDRNRGVGCGTDLGKNQQQDSRQSGPVPTEEEKHARLSLTVLSPRFSVLSKTDHSPPVADHPRGVSRSGGLRTGN